MDVIVISDPYRTPITAQRRDDGGVVLRGSRTVLLLSADEIDRLTDFVRQTPKLGELQRFPVSRENFSGPRT